MLRERCLYTVAGMRIDYKFVSLGALLVLLGFAAGYLLPLSGGQAREPDYSLAYDPQCNLNEAACRTRILDQGALSFSIEPRPIYGASPLAFAVQADGLDVEAATLTLSGVSMDMGSYHFELEADGSDTYQVDGNLPVCVRNQMQWKAELRLKTRSHGLVLVPYIFTAYKYGSRS